MHKLTPTSLYRLRTLATAGPRFYKATVRMQRLETLGLVSTTGRPNLNTEGIEYTITDAGRTELVERYGPERRRETPV